MWFGSHFHSRRFACGSEAGALNKKKCQLQHHIAILHLFTMLHQENKQHHKNQNLNSTRTGGTPYGPSHVSFNEKSELSKDEQDICLAYGKRFANLVKNL